MNTSYLKEIYEETEGGEEATTTSELAEKMHVTDASVSEAISKLEQKDLVCRAPYKGFTLSPMGKKEAEKIQKKYDILEKLLTDVGAGTPKKEAEKVVNDISVDTAEKIRDQILE